MKYDSSTQLFKLQAEICKTLADATRLAIVHELITGETSVGELITRLELPQSSVSRHLAVLRERGIVNSRREGTSVYYSLANPKIAEACRLVREVLQSQLMQHQTLAKSMSALTQKPTGS